MALPLQSANALWDFYNLNQDLKKSDVMVVLGNDDPRSAEFAAELFKEGWAPLVVVSGKEGTGTRGKYNEPEAKVFSQIMTSRGVPKDKIFLEPEATNTGENLVLSQELLTSKGIVPTSVLAVTKSCMELRVALTFAKQWRAAEAVTLTVTSPRLTLLEYPSCHVGSLEDTVVYLVDTFQKLSRYAELGYQAPVAIPVHVQKAADTLARYIEGTTDVLNTDNPTVTGGQMPDAYGRILIN